VRDGSRRRLFQPGILKDRRECCASAVGERVHSALPIVHLNPRIAIDCIACARIPTAVWSMLVAAQNRITRSCALSFVVAFATALPPPPALSERGHGGLARKMPRILSGGDINRVIDKATESIRVTKLLLTPRTASLDLIGTNHPATQRSA
jgi:hypothetical protein